jgi:hypothetical protein
MISINGGVDVGNLIAQAVQKVGKECRTINEIGFMEGMRFD